MPTADEATATPSAAAAPMRRRRAGPPSRSRSNARRPIASDSVYPICPGWRSTSDPDPMKSSESPATSPKPQPARRAVSLKRSQTQPRWNTQATSRYG